MKHAIVEESWGSLEGEQEQGSLAGKNKSESDSGPGASYTLGEEDRVDPVTIITQMGENYGGEERKVEPSQNHTIQSQLTKWFKVVGEPPEQAAGITSEKGPGQIGEEDKFEQVDIITLGVTREETQEEEGTASLDKLSRDDEHPPGDTQLTEMKGKPTPSSEQCDYYRGVCKLHKKKGEKYVITRTEWKDRGGGKGYGNVYRRTVRYKCRNIIVDGILEQNTTGMSMPGGSSVVRDDITEISAPESLPLLKKIGGD